MKKLLLLLTLFFSIESEAGESPVTEDDWDKFTTTLVLAGGIAFLVAVSSQTTNELTSTDYMYFDVQNNSIIFTGDSGLENFEINFSNQISQNVFESDSLWSTKDFYVGFKYRFWIPKWWSRVTLSSS